MMISQNLRDDIAEIYIGSQKMLEEIYITIDKQEFLMIFVRKVSGKTTTAIFKPNNIKIVRSKKGTMEPIITGTKRGRIGSFVSYYLNNIFQVRRIDPDTGLPKREGIQPTFENTIIFKNTKFNKWGHFPREKKE